jgi:hypothetical protein
MYFTLPAQHSLLSALTFHYGILCSIKLMLVRAYNPSEESLQKTMLVKTRAPLGALLQYPQAFHNTHPVAALSAEIHV